MTAASPLRAYAAVTAAYWAFMLSDGALRMLVLLHFNGLGFTPVQLAWLFLLYEVAGIVTNLAAGWLAGRFGLAATLHAGLGLQVVALIALAQMDPAWGIVASVAFVMAVQGLSGVAKDLAKMSSKSAVKLLAPKGDGGLFRWVAVLTGSKNAVKGLGFFLGAALLALAGFKAAVWGMAGVLAVILTGVVLFLPAGLPGRIKPEEAWGGWRSADARVNRLSLARLFLFGARDVWFVVGVPVYFQMVLSDGTPDGRRAAFFLIGGFLALWIIAYGAVQAAAPRILGGAGQTEAAITRKAILWSGLLVPIPFALAAAAAWAGGPSPGLTATLVAGLLAFGFVFAVNSSVHSYLILAFGDAQRITRDVGFYYMANAAGRLVGTLLSGLSYQWGGLPLCLATAGVMATLGWLAGRATPARRLISAPPRAQAARPDVLPCRAKPDSVGPTGSPQKAALRMELQDLSATALSALIAARKVAPSEVMAAHLARRAMVNGAVNAIVSARDPDDLMAEARALDTVAPRGWLHGIPFAVKDLVEVAGLRSTHGSPLFADHVPVRDDLLAARMRGAGAVFVGKTNVPEWGQGSHSFNPVFGVTRNPYDLTKSAGGSSGGAAAALATRMVWVADGSDMMGSLRNPAAFCNVYGFRPSWGLVPADAGGESFLSTLSTDGPMARTIEDIAGLLAVQAGINPAVPFGRGGFGGLGPADVRGLRIGWLGDWGGAYAMEPGILTLCQQALGELAAMGAVVVDLPPPFAAGDLWRSWVTLRAMLNAGGKRALYDTACDALKPETVWEIEQGLTLTAQAVYDASAIRSAWYARLADVFADIDILAMPSAQVWPFPADWRWPKAIGAQAMDTYHRWMEVVVPVSLAGVPSLSVPVGFGPQGLPMGMQIVGPVGSDARVLGIGQAWHTATDWPARRPSPL